MKRILTLTLAALMLLCAFTACGSGSGTPTQAPATEQPATSEPTAPAETATAPEEPDTGTEFSEKVKLTFGISGAPGHGTSVALQNAIDMIAERSGGAIEIELIGDGALGNEASLLAQAMEGSIDIAGCAIGVLSSYSDYLAIFQMPFLINSYELEAAVLKSDAWKGLVAAANADLETATIIGASEFGMRHFATIDKPILTMTDLSGMKIRTGGNPVIDSALQTVGANPVNVSFTELYSALQNKVVDGEEINATSVSMQKHYEVVNYVSEIGIYPWLSLTVMSNATIEALPEGYYELITECFTEADEAYMSSYIFEWDAQARQDCLDNGVEFNTIEDKDAWVEAMAPLYSEWISKGGVYESFITSVQELAKDF